MLNEYLENVREKNPLIHNITNYVTVNDCANILLASGAAPLMADENKEIEEIVAISQGLNINIGTLNSRTSEAMLLAGKRANELGIPVELDPVGVGASSFRYEFVQQLLKEVKFTTIKGNFSEIKLMAQGVGTTRGVDATETDIVTKNNFDSLLNLSREFSRQTGAIVIMSGATDIVSNSSQSAAITNGVEMMSKITGTGCMLSALVTGFIAANKEAIFDAAVSAVCLMGLAGEKAKEKVEKHSAGTSSFRTYLIDEIGLIEKLDEGAKYEIYK